MGSCGVTRPSDVLNGQRQKITMTKTSTHAQNLANMAENRIKVALKADSQQKLVFGATTIETCKT